MLLKLDTESQRHAGAIMAYINQPPDYLAGLVHSALLSGILSRGGEADVGAEAVRPVPPLDGAEVTLAPSDAPAVEAMRRAAALAVDLGLPVEVVTLAAVRVGFRRLVPPDNLLPAAWRRPVGVAS